MFKKIKKCVLPKRKRKRDDRDEFPIPSGNGDLEASTSGKVRPFCSQKMSGDVRAPLLRTTKKEKQKKKVRCM